MSIKFLAEDDRPREKFLLKGKNALSDSELLAIIMRNGSRKETAIELARKILDSVGNNWHELSKLSLQDLMKFHGVGQVKAIEISVALEIGKRRAAQEIPEKFQVKSSRDSFNILHPYISDLQTEEFWAIFLNQNNKILHKTRLTSGGINQSVVDIRILFKLALEHFSTGVIIAHNQPSGSLKPSQEDIKITKTIKDASNILQITLLDHSIIAQNSYFSFADEGIL